MLFCSKPAWLFFLLWNTNDDVVLDPINFHSIDKNNWNIFKCNILKYKHLMTEWFETSVFTGKSDGTLTWNKANMDMNTVRY